MILPLSEIERALEAGTAEGLAEFLREWKQANGIRVANIYGINGRWLTVAALDAATLLHNQAPAMIARIRELEGALQQAKVDAQEYRRVGLTEGAAYWQSGLEKINRDVAKVLKD